jgi:hypothetical protein
MRFLFFICNGLFVSRTKRAEIADVKANHMESEIQSSVLNIMPLTGSYGLFYVPVKCYSRKQLWSILKNAMDAFYRHLLRNKNTKKM